MSGSLFPTSPRTLLGGYCEFFASLKLGSGDPLPPLFDTPLFQESPIVVGAVNFVGPIFIWGIRIGPQLHLRALTTEPSCEVRGPLTLDLVVHLGVYLCGPTLML